MSRALLDVNVLLALLDRDHVHHQPAREWIEAESMAGWASCAITQNGFVRIISQPRYPSPISPTEAIGLLQQACTQPHHAYWRCDVSLIEPAAIERTRIHGPRQVTDAYLLALATQRAGRFVTFDSSIPLSAVPGATAGNLVTL